MRLRLSRSTDEVIIGGIRPFNLLHTLECGQAFRWERNGSWYMGIVRGRVLWVRQAGEGLGVFRNGPDDSLGLVVDYFDLEKDYGAIEAELKGMDSFLAEAVKFGSGLRILQQEPWECLISFIISAHNRIPFIRRAIRMLAERFGEPACGGDPGMGGVSRGEGSFPHRFPTPMALAMASVEDLSACHTGFRAPYIREAAMKVASGDLQLEALRDLATEEARSRLMKLRGVGEKVADCVLLFSLGKHDAFPVDVWIARVMQEVYMKEKERVSLREIRELARRKFKALSGYAQEYLYYYARNRATRGANQP